MGRLAKRNGRFIINTLNKYLTTIMELVTIHIVRCNCSRERILQITYGLLFKYIQHRGDFPTRYTNKYINPCERYDGRV